MFLFSTWIRLLGLECSNPFQLALYKIGSGVRNILQEQERTGEIVPQIHMFAV